MPDRFANGDPANDDPPVSRGPSRPRSPATTTAATSRASSTGCPTCKDLGITALWLNPWYDNANRLNEKEIYDDRPITDYHGYGAVDFYGVDEHFGDLATLRELVDAAHALGIKVIQDQVANHTGSLPPLGGRSAHAHLVQRHRARAISPTRGRPGPSGPAGDAASRAEATLDGWFIDILPDLNQDDEETARYLIQNTLWWVGVTGLDGIRQDTLPYVPRALLARLDGGHQARVPAPARGGRAVRRRPRPRLVLPGRRAPLRRHRHRCRHPLRLPAPTSRCARPSRRASRCGTVAMMLARDHLYPRPDGSSPSWAFTTSRAS